MSVAGVAHPVERHLAKVEVASSSLVTRSIRKTTRKCGLSFMQNLNHNGRDLSKSNMPGACWALGRGPAPHYNLPKGQIGSEPHHPLHKKTTRKCGLSFYVIGQWQARTISIQHAPFAGKRHYANFFPTITMGASSPPSIRISMACFSYSTQSSGANRFAPRTSRG